MKTYYVYILSSSTGTLYIGMTNDLERRMVEHKNKLVESFTKRYNIDRLIYIEAQRSLAALGMTNDIRDIRLK